MTNEQISAALAATERFGNPSRWRWRLWLLGSTTKLGLAFLVENLSSFAIRLMFPRYVPVFQRHFPWDSTEDWIRSTLPPDIIEMACGEPTQALPAHVIETIQVNIGRGQTLMTHYRALLYRCVPWLFLASIVLVLGIDLWYLLQVKTAIEQRGLLDACVVALGYICMMTSTSMGLGLGRSR